MSVRIVNNSDAFKQALHLHLAENLGAGAELLRAEIQAAIGTQGPPRSSPGEAPHRDTGDLQESITDQLDPDALVARVSSDSDYALSLELGSAGIAARPYFLATLISYSDDIARRICKPL